MAAVQQTHHAVGWRFWGFWMLATIAAGVLSIVIMIPIDRIMVNLKAPNGPMDPAATTDTLLIFLLTGTATVIMAGSWGLGQWLVLRRELTGTGWWIPATGLGLALGGLAGSNLHLVVPREIDRIVNPSILVVSIGLGMGIAQWFVLYRRVRQAGWWILISPAAWLVAFLLTGLIEIAGLYIEPMDMLFAFLVPTALCGAGLVWLLRHTPI